MKTKEEKKEFALSQLAPYLADPKTCGYEKEYGNCEYLTPDGRMCVAGKNMINPEYNVHKDIKDLLSYNDDNQEGLFKPEVVGILTNQEWKFMQMIHDSIAKQPKIRYELESKVNKLNLFSIDELEERAKSLE
jgi:hypothetical protein